MPQKLLTIKAIAKQLDQPESNIRYYRDRFEEYIPFEGKGRKRRYYPEAVDVFGYIASRLKENTAYEDILNELKKKFSQNPQIPTDTPFSSDLPPQTEITLPETDYARIFESQAKSLEYVCQILKNREAQEKRLERLFLGYQKCKKALISLWRKSKTLEQQKLPPVEENIQILQERVKILEKRQIILEQIIIKQVKLLKQTQNK